jgi:hypothetical protein
VVALVCSVGAMGRVVDAQPVGFWDLWCPSVVEAVVGKGDFAMEVWMWLVRDLIVRW